MLPDIEQIKLMENIKLVRSSKRPEFKKSKLELPRTLDPIDHDTMFNFRFELGKAWLDSEITNEECIAGIAYVMWLYKDAGKNQTLQAAHNDPIQS